MPQIPEKAPKVKCGFCGRVMDVSEWSTEHGAHQYCHGGSKPWKYTPAQLARRAERRESGKPTKECEA